MDRKETPLNYALPWTYDRPHTANFHITHLPTTPQNLPTVSVPHFYRDAHPAEKKSSLKGAWSGSNNPF